MSPTIYSYFIFIIIVSSDILTSNALTPNSWNINDHDGGICDGTCQLAVTCFLSGGQIEPVGNCHSIFQVCCDYGQTVDALYVSQRRNGLTDGSAAGPANVTLDENLDGVDGWNETVENDPQCGRAVIAKRRVVGGREAGFGEFPWQALVRMGAARCGGALVSHEHVITAGHCVHSLYQQFGSFPPAGIHVSLGEYSLNGEVEPLPKQTFSVARIYLHPHYEFTLQADRYDVAVLRLSRRVRYEPHILPICLPKRDALIEEGMVAMVAGWGAMDPDSPKRPKELQVVDVNIIDSKLCERWHSNNKIEITIYKDMMCAGHEKGGKDACQGDSGGPLMNKDADDGRWTLIGVVSAGFSCARPGQPGIYHRVPVSTGWVSHIIRSTAKK